MVLILLGVGVVLILAGYLTIGVVTARIMRHFNDLLQPSDMGFIVAFWPIAWIAGFFSLLGRLAGWGQN